MTFDRLVHTGNAVVDIVLDVPQLPVRGGDVLATATTTTTGGGFNVMAAAARLGLRTVYAGAHGAGPRGDLVRRDLHAEGIAVLSAPDPAQDTGFVVALVDAAGERTFVTSPGAEAHLRTLDAGSITADDAVYISGYSLGYQTNRAALLDLLSRLDANATVVMDPGPLISSVPREVVDVVLERADWLTVNRAEAAALTGESDPALAAAQLTQRCPRRAGVLVRLDRHGVLLSVGGEKAMVPAVPVEPIDSNGAGDAHTGAFLAALAAAVDVRAAVAYANRAAAYAVTKRGPATGPTTRQLAAWKPAPATY